MFFFSYWSSIPTSLFYYPQIIHLCLKNCNSGHFYMRKKYLNLRTFLNPENWLADKDQLFACLVLLLVVLLLLVVPVSAWLVVVFLLFLLLVTVVLLLFGLCESIVSLPTWSFVCSFCKSLSLFKNFVLPPICFFFILSPNS